MGDFCPLKKFFEIFLPKYHESPLCKVIMTEVSRHLRNIFFHKIPPILKLEVGFFSDRKKFFADFRKLDIFFSAKVYFYKKKKIREPFLSHFHFTSLSRLTLQVSRVVP